MAMTLPVLNATALTESGGEPVVTKYIFFNGKRVAMDRDGVVQWLVGDHLGTTSVVLNADGTVHSEARHYPYGEERWSSGTLPTDYRFTGQRHDGYIKLTIMGARWYDARLGRWISPDSIIPDPANPQSSNRYSYVFNRPLVLTDPSGHAPSDGCEYEGCLSDPDSWGWEFIVYLLENTDFADPRDNPTGQIIIRTFEFILPLGREDGASDNEIVTEAIIGTRSLIEHSMKGWYPIADPSELLVVSGAFIVAAESDAGDILDRGGLPGGGGYRYRWPETAEQFDGFVGVTGSRIPDGPATPGRNKVEWKLSDDLTVTYEQHPYHLGAPPSHTGPHWHMSYPKHPYTPGALPGTPIPGKWIVR